MMTSMSSGDGLHEAAAAGDLARVQSILAYPHPPLQPNAPDAEGRSAIFYAQIRGHTDVTNFLVQHGWTAMPEGNLWRGGPGGRTMFWKWHQDTARPVSTTRPVNDTDMTKHVRRETAKQDWQSVVAKRDLRRKYAYASNPHVVGKAHKLYARKTAGCSLKSHCKPGLNT